MAPSRCLSLLPLTACCAAAGWFGSRAIHESLLPAGQNRVRQATIMISKAPDGPVVKPDTPEGKWMARARAAAASEDFAALFEELDTLFPESSRSGERQAAMQWLLGLWIARDADGAAAWVAERNNTLTGGFFGMMLARVAPEKVAAFLNGPLRDKFGATFRGAALRALAEADPQSFLKLEISGEDQEYERHWTRALQSLGSDDPAAAVAVWANSGRMGSTGQAALFSLVHDWMARDPQALRGWMDSLKDTECRRLAQHAWLSALARKDLAAARRELEHMDPGAWLPGQDARMAILAALARENPAAALAEMERFKQTIEVPEPKESDDPFAAQNDPANELRQAVLEGIAPGLPNDPAQLLLALRNLAKDSSLSEDAQRSLADLKLRDWNKETAIQTIQMLLPDEPNNRSLREWMRQSLVQKLTREDPARGMDLYASLTTAGREAMSYPFIRGIIDAHDPELTLRLAALVPPDRWNMYGANTLGGELGKTPESAKAIIEELPLNSNYQEAHTDFTRVWARSDPQAAAQWVEFQAKNLYAARGLAESWAVYDDGAASAWAAGLPEGPLRDGAAQGLVHAIASADPESAWQWAASMSSRYQAAEAYRDLARWWGKKAPPEFAADYTEAMKRAGRSEAAMTEALESLKQPPPYRHINP